MLSYYRGHVIVMLDDEMLSAEITERSSGAPLPTKVSALSGEDADAVFERARALIDIYMHTRDEAAGMNVSGRLG